MRLLKPELLHATTPASASTSRSMPVVGQNRCDVDCSAATISPTTARRGAGLGMTERKQRVCSMKQLIVHHI